MLIQSFYCVQLFYPSEFGSDVAAVNHRLVSTVR